jgi:hypothetical protein
MGTKLGKNGMPCGIPVFETAEPQSIEQQVIDFLDGRDDGAKLFDALYGDTLDELLPARLTDLLAAWRAH